MIQPRAKSLIPIVAILACLAPFIPGLTGPFLHDDAVNLASLKVGPFSLQSALDAAFRNESGLLRRPLSNLSLATNLWLHGDSPFGFKLFNLFLHGACGLALLAFLRALLHGLKPEWDPRRRDLVAVLASMLWVIHPLQVSTTLYVVQRMAQWPALFLFLLGWRFQRYLNAANPAPRAAAAFVCEWLVLLALALASKENGALAPLLMAVLWVLHRCTHPQTSPPLRWVALVTIALPLLAGAWIVATHPDFVLVGYAAREFTPAQRLLTEAVALWHYQRLWFLPWIPWMGLYTNIPTFDTGDMAGWLAMAAWLAVAALALARRRRWPLFSFAILWFLAAHAMESTILPLELVYEHRNYLAMPGMALLAAAGIEWLSGRMHLRPSLLAAPILLALGGATLHRAHTWSSPDAFALSEYAHHPSSNRAVMMLLSRSVAVGDKPTTQQLMGEIRTRNRDALWPLALDIAMQCTAIDYPVDWQRLRNGIRLHGTENRVMQLLRQTAVNRISGNCPNLDVDQFQQVLESGYKRAIADDNRLQVELYGTYLAWLARNAGDDALASRWFLRTARAAPDAVEPLFDLAYAHLNAGRLPEAAAAIAELRRREQAHGLHIGYRIDELDGFMAQEHAKQGR